MPGGFASRAGQVIFSETLLINRAGALTMDCPVRIKICGIRDEADLDAAVCAGVDAVGFLVGREHESEDFISPEKAAALAGRTPPGVNVVLTTHKTAPLEVRALVSRIGVHTVQLHGGVTVPQAFLSGGFCRPRCA